MKEQDAKRGKKINRDARNKPGMSSLFHLQASLRVQYNYQETSSIWLKKLVNIVHSVNSQCYLSLSFLVVYLFSSISLSCGIKYVCRNKMLQYSWMHAKREREKENSVLGCIKRFNFNTHSILESGRQKNYIHRDDSIRLSTIISGICD